MLKKIFLSLLFSAGLFSQKSPITTAPWQEVVISVSNLDRTAEFFKSIGGYEETFRGRSSASSIKHFGLNADASAEELLLAAKGATSGLLGSFVLTTRATSSPCVLGHELGTVVAILV